MQNIENMRRQFRSMGATFSWKHEVVTADPSYYRWNQWMFLRFLEKGLAYRKMSPVDWCPNDGTLAREQVEGADRHCWRCGALVEKRDLEQWYLRTTAYADELLDFTRHRLAGAHPHPADELDRPLGGRGDRLRDGAVRPPSRAARRCACSRRGRTRCSGPRSWSSRRSIRSSATLTAPEKRAEVDAYVEQARRRTEIDRLSTDREKTGVAIGADAINPINGEQIPIFIADYVLSGYGTGRDHGRARARRARLRVRPAVRPADPARRRRARARRPTTRWPTPTSPTPRASAWSTAAPFDGMPADEGGKAIVAKLAEAGKAEPKVTYRLRDWLISRQRYWGTPIPIIYCETDGIVPVPDADLPVRLPENVDYKGRGDNPLNHDEAFLRVDCPRCGGPARRETDTMDTFVDSSWYWFRYLSPDDDDGPVDSGDGRCLDPGRPVHGWRRARRDAPDVQPVLDQGDARLSAWSVRTSPSCGMFNQGQILGADGERMSKSRGNVQDPDELVARYGADTVRLYLMFMGPWDQGGPWSPTGIGGPHHFLNRVWTLTIDPHGREPGDPDAGNLPAGEDVAAAEARLRSAAHRTLRDVTADYEAYHFNTMVAKLMELSNTLFRYRGTPVAGGAAWDEAIRMLLLMLAPAAPHITEELWSRRAAEAGREWSSIHTESWPEVDVAATAESTREVPVQVNGKLRDKLTVAAAISGPELEAAALASPKVTAILAGRQPDKIILAGGGRLINIVVREV